jgi:hypothetical protein
MGKTVFWAGRRYSLLRDGTLEPVAPEMRLKKNEPFAVAEN